jgi:hypothetical protein
MATTIQDRMHYLCRATGLSPEKLSLKAGLSKRFIRRIITDPTRTSLMAEAAEKLSYATGKSRSWIVSGVGTPDETDVPKLPPLVADGEALTRERLPDWISLAKRAIEIDAKTANGNLDWAIMGVGEQPSKYEDLTAYAILDKAERFKDLNLTYEERRRLDHKARRFRKEHLQAGARSAQPVQQRRSVPPKG